MDDRRGNWAICGVLVAVLAGAALRLVWADDMEYKADEVWTYRQVKQIEQGALVPWLGMPSSQDVRNPGMSLWVFVGLARLTDIDDPVDLVRAVQVANVVALIGLALFAWYVVPIGEREYWLWAVALVAVNPIATLFHRKIWPPSVFPLLVVCFLLAWWNRHRWLGALGWGVVGACLGQIQPAGFFFALGFVVWAGLFDRKGVRWTGWFVGSILATLPMIPWIDYLAGGDAPYREWNPRFWTHAFEGKFWVRWVLEPIGLGLDYSLGKDYVGFLSSPVVAGTPTFLVLLLHLVAVAAGGTILIRAGRRWWLERGQPTESLMSPTELTVGAALWGYGLVLTLSCLPIHRQYMIVLFPLQALWLARLALGSRPDPEGRADRPTGRSLLGTLFIAQLLITGSFLAFVHGKDRIRGDYGQPYAAKIRHAEVTNEGSEATNSRKGRPNR